MNEYYNPIINIRTNQKRRLHFDANVMKTYEKNNRIKKLFIDY